MKKFFVILLTMGLASFMVACATPEEKSLRTLQDLYEDMELNHENYTVEDWEKIITSLLSGMFLLFIDGYTKVVMIDARTYPARSVAEPENGPMETAH